jgi:Alpha amylase, catalytic domain
MPWSGDGFGPLDFTLLDRHHGAIEDWRNLITEIHRRDMYVIFDNTMATMGDLIAFDGFVNASTPFNFHEYDFLWKNDRRYHDFQPGNERNDSCQYPRMWAQDGFPITQDILDQMDGCKESEFDLVFRSTYTHGETSLQFLVWRYQRHWSISKSHQLIVEVCVCTRSIARVATRRLGKTETYVMYANSHVRY